MDYCRTNKVRLTKWYSQPFGSLIEAIINNIDLCLRFFQLAQARVLFVTKFIEALKGM